MYVDKDEFDEVVPGKAFIIQRTRQMKGGTSYPFFELARIAKKLMRPFGGST